MKTKTIALMALAAIMAACNPTERKAAKTAAEKVVQSYRKFNSSEAGKVVKTVNRINTVERIVNQQPSYYICPQCAGYGYVVGFDSYGNVITDYNGNPVPYLCPNCKGQGYVSH